MAVENNMAQMNMARVWNSPLNREPILEEVAESKYDNKSITELINIITETILNPTSQNNIIKFLNGRSKQVINDLSM